MRLNTMITLGASAAFGIVAVVLARGWINGAVENEFRDTRTVTHEQNQDVQDTVPVLVADVDLQFGDIITQAKLKTAQFPIDSIPLESFETFQDIAGPNISENPSIDIIALKAIRRNEPILPHKISGPHGKGSLSARIRPGYRAASIRVDAVTGVSGFIVPGDIVDIIYTASPNAEDDTPFYESNIILQSVLVLGIDQNQSDETDKAKLAKTVTVEVSHNAAQRLSVATQTGHLSLILRAIGETQPSTTQSVSTQNLTKKRISKQHRAGSPASKPRIKTAPKATTNNVAQITIIRGETTESVSVISETGAQQILSDNILAGG
ncbi:MAG: Flp pilus assembly protein CpaB [Litorimonas sp.]